MQSLYPLTDEMRALGIRRITIELEPRDTLVPATDPLDRPTEAPPTPGPEKGPGTCQKPGCSNPNGGVMGAAPELCERHALEAAGVR